MEKTNGKKKSSLDKKTINAIADKVEARLRNTGEESSRGKKNVQYREEPKGGSKKVFFWGAASGLAVAIAAPLFGKQARPVVRGVIKGGLVAGRYVQKVASSVKEDMQDMTAEAKSDLDQEAR